MWRKVIKVLLLLSVVGVITGGSIHYWDYISEPWGDKAETFPYLYKAVTDGQDDVFAITHSKGMVEKVSAKGTLEFRVSPKSGYTFEDIAVASSGDFYAQENNVDNAGRLISRAIEHFNADGSRDAKWDATLSGEFKSDPNKTLSDSVMSLQVKNDKLYYFHTEDYRTYTLNSVTKSKVSRVTQFALPANQDLMEVTGTDAQHIIYTTYTGQMYRLNTGLLYPPATKASGETQSFPSYMRLDAQDNLYFIDGYGDAVKKLNLAEPSKVEKIVTYDVASQWSSASDEKIKSIDLSSSGDLLMKVDDHVIKVGKQNQVEPIDYSGAMRWFHYLFVIVALFGLVSLYVAIKTLYREIYPYSLFAKQMLVTLPLVLVAVAAIFYFMYNEYKSDVLHEVEHNLMTKVHEGQVTINTDALKRVTSPLDYKNNDYQQITAKLNFDDNEGKFFMTVYKMTGDKLYSVVDASYKMFEPFNTKVGKNMVCEATNSIDSDQWTSVDSYDAVKTYKYMACSNKDEWGSWLSAMGPLYSADHSQVVGVYEMGLYPGAYNSKIDAFLQQDLKLFTTLCLIVMVLLIIGTQTLMTPIFKLQDGASKLANEQWDVEVNVKTRDELALLARTFNFMARNIREYIAATTNLSNSYKRFVPQQQLDMLGKPSILDVQLGDQVEREMSVLVVKIRSFHEISKDMSPEENFSFMNKFLQYIAPPIRDHHGLINKYLGDGVLALFPDQPLAALETAVVMRKSLEEYNDGRTRKGKMPVDLGIAIHKGPMVLGIIGEGQRLDGNVLSDDVNFVSALEELSIKVGATLLVPADLMRMIDPESKFGSRSLGLIQFEENEHPTELCDVYDADSEGQRKLKAKTKALFEQAVLMYQQGRFYDARERFLQVIKQNQEDKIAKLYFYQCDEFFQRGTSADWNGTLDVS